MSPEKKARYTDFIKLKSRELGFSYCGVSKATQLQNEAEKLESWLNRGMHGDMKWMENHFDKRIDPRKLVPGAKSVISLLLNYYPTKTYDDKVPKISKYAYGDDYHHVIKRKLKTFVSVLTEELGDFDGRVFVDSAPVMDKVWAEKSGLGWIGKNTNLINPKSGSFFFVCELICDLELIPDPPIRDYCGTCTACIDACPTDAIEAPYLVNGSKCISYFTIELKSENPIPSEYQGKFENWAFGCDICQDVCPWNRFSKAHSEKAFQPHPELFNLSENDWKDITEDVFQEIFRRSAVKRTKLAGLRRNVEFLFPGRTKIDN